jgi:hypothetical protein
MSQIVQTICDMPPVLLEYMTQYSLHLQMGEDTGLSMLLIYIYPLEIQCRKNYHRRRSFTVTGIQTGLSSWPGTVRADVLIQLPASPSQFREYEVLVLCFLTFDLEFISCLPTEYLTYQEPK